MTSTIWLSSHLGVKKQCNLIGKIKRDQSEDGETGQHAAEPTILQTVKLKGFKTRRKVQGTSRSCLQDTGETVKTDADRFACGRLLGQIADKNRPQGVHVDCGLTRQHLPPATYQPHRSA